MGKKKGNNKKSSVDFQAENDEILTRLDIKAEYAALGVVFASEHARASGKIECYARDREERKPSAWCDVVSGRYGDSGGSGYSASLWDFAAKFGNFATWQDAKAHYAQKVGVKLSAKIPEDSIAEKLDLLDWTPGRENQARIWGLKHKRGISVEAIKLAGGRLGRYPCWRDKEDVRHAGRNTVIALPAYGEKGIDEDPVAWVLWDVSGGTFEIRRGKDVPPDHVKMKSIGSTAGAMMNFHSLARLAEDNNGVGDGGEGETTPVELIHKTAGPTDLLAVLTAILRDTRELIDRHLVTCNASGETGDILPHNARLFRGHRAVLWGDDDKAGRAGVVKWIQGLAGIAGEIRVARFEGGKDVRDFLNGVPVEGEVEGVDGDGEQEGEQGVTEGEQAGKTEIDLFALDDAPAGAEMAGAT